MDSASFHCSCDEAPSELQCWKDFYLVEGCDGIGCYQYKIWWMPDGEGCDDSRQGWSIVLSRTFKLEDADEQPYCAPGFL